MDDRNARYPTQHIGTTIMVVMMQVQPEDEEIFNRWYDEEHLLERLEIPGYISARRFKLEEGEGLLNFLCIWELEDASPLQSEMYQEQRARITDLHRRANEVIKQRARGVYKQIYPVQGAFEDHSGFHPEATPEQVAE